MNLSEITSFQTRNRHDAVLPHSNDGFRESDQVEESHPYEVVPFGEGSIYVTSNRVYGLKTNQKDSHTSLDGGTG